MPPDSAPVVPPPGASTLLTRYRDRMTFWLAVIVTVTLTPFAIYDFASGARALGSALGVMISILIVGALAIHRQRPAPVPFALVLFPIAVAIGLSIANQGIYGVLWCYPTVLFCYFILPTRWALAFVSAMAVGYLPLIYERIGPDVAIRFAASAGITVAAITLIASTINDLQRQLLGQIITDPLTGAFNRRHMDAVLADTIERYNRVGAPASILMIDIDHFKRINDTHGHLAGDKVLKALVEAILTRSRRLDRLFRMGGEEFVLLLPDTRRADATIRAENLRQMVAQANLLAGEVVTVSIGISDIANDSVASWIAHADEALYAAKRAGRNCVVAALPRANSPS